jgi:hypothetical protein
MPTDIIGDTKANYLGGDMYTLIHEGRILADSDKFRNISGTIYVIKNAWQPEPEAVAIETYTTPSIIVEVLNPKISVVPWISTAGHMADIYNLLGYQDYLEINSKHESNPGFYMDVYQFLKHSDEVSSRRGNFQVENFVIFFFVTRYLELRLTKNSFIKYR